MKHYGDITKLSGYELPVVDVITGGSPCQDLSVAGKREGLAGERSGLFMEQIRIIKEMREKDESTGRTDEFIRPRYMVWENVPGTFSSNNGEDFRAVLEETAKVIDKDAVIPRPEGKWSTSGVILGDGWSIAWRVHDAQFWGVPQRRKRLSLVADFGGETAPEILFERKGLSGDLEQSSEKRETTPRATEKCPDPSSYTLKIRGGIERDSYGKKAGKGALIQTELSGTLGVSQDQTLITKCLNPWDIQSKHIQSEDGVAESLYAGECRGGGGESYVMQDSKEAVIYGISPYDSNAMKSSNPTSGIYEAETSRTLDLNGGNPACNQGGIAIVCIEGNGSRPSHKGDGYKEGEVMYTLNSTENHAVAIENHPTDGRVKISEDGKVQTLLSRMGTGGGNVPLVIEPYTSSKASYHQKFTNDGKAETLVASDYKDPPICAYSIVRRLTPLECERLQGYPDGWTDIGDWIDSKGKKHKGDSDSPRYKALGNSIAIPYWFWLLRRISAEYERPATLGSLFDGIGGFPLCWERCNGKGTAIWASEIEEFCIAVTKIRFPEEE